MSKPRRNAREDILNTAERLFAENGIENVSLRAINAEAGYSAAALHYHFRSRDKLLEALLLDRQQPVLALRTELLESLASDPEPSLESLARALVLPFARLVLEDPERGLTSVKFFFRAYVEQSGHPQVRATTEKSLKIFFPLLSRAQPGVKAETLRIRWLLATELAFQGLANMESIIAVGGGRANSKGQEQYVEQLVEFVAGGLAYRSGA